MTKSYAKKVWQDRAGGLHDLQEDAWAASRIHAIGLRMHKEFVPEFSHAPERIVIRTQEAVRWFLADPDAIIAKYQAICVEVDRDLNANL